MEARLVSAGSEFPDRRKAQPPNCVTPALKPPKTAQFRSDHANAPNYARTGTRKILGKTKEQQQTPQLGIRLAAVLLYLLDVPLR
jgi:hypothetical protein